MCNVVATVKTWHYRLQLHSSCRTTAGRAFSQPISQYYGSRSPHEKRPARLCTYTHNRHDTLITLAHVLAMLDAQAAKKKGVTLDVVEKKLNDLEAVLPGLVNLHKAKASDWVGVFATIPVLCRYTEGGCSL